MSAILEVKFQFHFPPLWVLSRKLFLQGPQFSLAHLDCKKISFPLGIHHQVSWFWLSRRPLDTSLFCDTLIGQRIRGTQEAHPSIGKQICTLLVNPTPKVPQAPLQSTRCWIHTSCGRWTWIGGNQSAAQLTGSDRLQTPFFYFCKSYIEFTIAALSSIEKSFVKG